MISSIDLSLNNKESFENAKENFSLTAKKMISDRHFSFIYQRNDIATALGNLSLMEQKLFDYCTSLINKNDKYDAKYCESISSVMKTLNLKNSGLNKKRVIAAYLKLIRQVFIVWDGKTRTFRPFNIFNLENSYYSPEADLIGFSFSSYISPYLFFLRNRYYAYPLMLTTRLSSKYSMIAVRLMSAADHGEKKIILKGSLYEWESWMGLINENGKMKYTASQMRQFVFNVLLKELSLYFSHYTFSIKNILDGHKVKGYKFIINKDDYVMNLKNPMSDEILAIEKNEKLHSLK